MGSDCILLDTGVMLVNAVLKVSGESAGFLRVLAGHSLLMIIVARPVHIYVSL